MVRGNKYVLPIQFEICIVSRLWLGIWKRDSINNPLTKKSAQKQISELQRTGSAPPSVVGSGTNSLLVSVLSAVWIDHDDQDNPSPIPETFRTPPCCLTPMMMSPDLWAFRQRSPRAINDTAAEDLLLGCPHGDSTTAVSATAVARNPQAPPPAHADSSTPGYSEDRYHPCPVPLRHVPVIQRIQCCDPRPGPTLCLSGSSQHL
ncbi:hypothetical protein J6590_089935 [Homalodisca vitripennis]|nr:hypothetical protein J6590_089935 [Homalodisca vitripennis]